MRVELLMVGDELLAGAIVDSNAPWLMSRIYDLGLLVLRKTTVADDVPAIAAELEAAIAGRSDLVVVCGGLGPTEDDLTSKAVASALGLPRGEDPEARAFVEERLSYIGMKATERQLRQALLPSGAKALENPYGTAPGFSIEAGKTTLFFLPGPPREFRPLAERFVLPWVEERLEGTVHQAKTLRCFGRGESKLAEIVDPIVEQIDGVRVGYQVVYPEVHLRLRASADSEAVAKTLLENSSRRLEEALGEWLYGRDEETMATVVGSLLSDGGHTLALAESCTGGLIGSLMTDIAGASGYFLGSFVTYADAMKTGVLAVPEETLARDGAVSESCAVAMAEGARSRAGATLSVSVTGVAGPGGGTEEKPVGTVCFGLSSKDEETTSYRRLFRGDREMIRRMSAFFALDLVRRRLAGLPMA